MKKMHESEYLEQFIHIEDIEFSIWGIDFLLTPAQAKMIGMCLCALLDEAKTGHLPNYDEVISDDFDLSQYLQ